MTTVLCLDTETGGTNVYEDRIVTIFLGLMSDDPDRPGSPSNFAEDDGLPLFQRSYYGLINPGVEIPQAAINVHGITNEYAKSHGAHPSRVLEQVYGVLYTEAIENRIPVVAYNAPFDLTLLRAEFARHLPELPPFPFERLTIIDPLVIDKELYRYRKGTGAHQLVRAAPAYSVPVDLDKAHDASYDCLLAGRIALRQIDGTNPAHARSTFSPKSLHLKQEQWKAEQNKGLAQWSLKNRKGYEVQLGWPLYSGEVIQA